MTTRAIMTIIISLWGSVAAAQDGPKAAEKERSLDDLLGIGGADSTKAHEESARAQREELTRSLSASEAQNAFIAAITSMQRSATLLRDRDSGTAVQRIQEDVITRLDALIDAAQQQQRQQQASASADSKSSGSSQGEPKDGGKSGSDKAGSSEEQRRREANNRAQAERLKGEKPGDEQQAGNNPDRPGEAPPTDASVEGGIIEETEEEWGKLPPRMREILRQGVREKMSSVYRRWTEAYYRRIAQESKR
ncbi:MAG: hypothetical protein EXS03_07920 [Phycisphaerales bacterium]|nr:hypothetical protein [Phycisphaerales bacterium]